MKRICLLFTLVGAMTVFTACSHLLLPKSNTVTFNLSVSNTVITNRAVDLSDVKVIKITVTDSAGTVHPAEIQISTINDTETKVIDDIALGMAHIAAYAYGEDETAPLLYAATDKEILAGENEINLTLAEYDPNDPGNNEDPGNGGSGSGTGSGGGNGSGSGTGSGGGDPEDPPATYYTITLVAGGTTEDLSTKDSLTAADFSNVADQGKVSEYRTFLYWMDSNGNPITLTANEAVTGWVSQVHSNVTLKAKYGVYFDSLSNYLSSTDVWDNLPANPTAEEAALIADLKDVYVLKGEATTTSIPLYSHHDNATGITLDYSNCTQLTSVGNSAFINKGDKWVKVLKLPETIATIQGIKGIEQDIYIALPKINSGSIKQLTFASSNISDSSGVTYKIHFAGTAADWAIRTKSSSGRSSHILGYARGFYLRDSSGQEITIWDDDTGVVNPLILNSTYTDNTGVTQDLTEIGQFAFRWCKCSKIEIPETITEFKNDASFAYTTATEVYFGNQITSIHTATFFYDGTDARTVYFKGTLDDWMKLSCDAGYDSAGANGGPLMGASDLKVWDGSQYNSVLDADGALTLTLDSDHQLKGHFEGLKGLKKLSLNGPSQELQEYTFYGCTNLTDVYLDAANQELNGDSDIFTCASTTFSGLTGVKVHVSDALLSKYASDSTWKSLIQSRKIELWNYSGTNHYDSNNIGE